MTTPASDPHAFERLLRSRLPDDLARAAELKLQAERAAALEPLNDRVFKHNYSRAGSEPEHVLPSTDAELCRSFLAFMAEHGYPGIISLYHREDVTEWDTALAQLMTRPTFPTVFQGYPLGVLTLDGRVLRNFSAAQATSTELRDRDSLVAYLCKDGKLRTGRPYDAERSPHSSGWHYAPWGDPRRRAEFIGAMPWAVDADTVSIVWAFDRIQPWGIQRIQHRGHWEDIPAHQETKWAGGGYWLDSPTPMSDSPYTVDVPAHREYREPWVEERAVPVTLERHLLALTTEALRLQGPTG